jgi:hypothetical protein
MEVNAAPTSILQALGRLSCQLHGHQRVQLAVAHKDRHLLHCRWHWLQLQKIDL